MPFPHSAPQTQRDGHSPLSLQWNVLCSSDISQFLLLTFHLPVLGGIEKGCLLRGPSEPHMRAHPRSGHPLPYTAQAKGFPLPICCVHCQCCAHPRHPTPPAWGPTSSLGQGLMGAGGQVGGPGGGEGEGDAQLPHVSARWGGVRDEWGAPGGYFSIFYFQIFLYLNLQICIIQGQPIKEDYNNAPWNSGMCRGGGVQQQSPSSRII